MKHRTLRKALSIVLLFGMLFSMVQPMGGVQIVNAAEVDTVWTLLDDIDAAAESEQPVAITMVKEGANPYALTAKTTGSAPVAKGATLDGDSLLIEGGKDDYGWNVTKNENEGVITYTFQNSAGDYLYLTAANNGVKVGSKPTTGGDWQLSAENYLTAIDSKPQTRYVGIYNNADWRCYTSINNNIKDQTLQFWQYDRDEAGQETPITDIATVLAASSGEFKVKGVITFIDGRNIYIQDETGGICPYIPAADSSLSIGDTVIATGSKTVYKGLPELNNAVLEKVTDDTIDLTAKNTTIDAITDSDICTYIAIPSLTVTSVSGDNVTLKDENDNTILLYKPVTEETLKEGDIIDFTGALGIFNSTKQLRNTVASEITVTGTADPSTDPVDPNPTGNKFGLAKELATGDEVIIYNATSGMAVGNTIASYKVTGVSLAPENGVITTDNTDVVWTVTKNSDGTYTFTQGDNTLGGLVSGSYKNLVLTGATYTAWTLDGPDSSDFNYFAYLDEMDKSKGTVYLEYYNGFTLYGSSAPEKKAFGLTFYKKGADPETPTTDPGTDPTGDKFGLAKEIATGDEVIIHLASKNMAVGNTVASNKITGVALAPADGVITTDNTDVVWTVNKNSDGTYTFTQDDKTLGGVVAESNGKTYNNLVPTGATYTNWTLEGPDSADFNYYAYLGEMANSFGKTYLEYYNGFTLYGSSNPTRDQYGFTFYKKGAEPDVSNPDDPAETGDLVTDLSKLNDGDTVAIYSPSHKTAASTKANGDWYLKAVDATVSEGKVQNFTNDLVWTVKKNANGTYSFYSYNNPEDSLSVWPSGNYAELTVNTTYNSDTKNEWTVTPAATKNCFYIYSPDVAGTNGQAYVEAYVRNGTEVFSGYFTKPRTNLETELALQFYLVNAEDALSAYDDGEWDGVLNPEKEYVVYNANAASSLGLAKEATYSLNAVETEITSDNLAIPGNGAYLFKVESMGRYYAFSVDGKYLATNKDEELFFLDKNADGSIPETAKWFLTKRSGNSEQMGGNVEGYLLYNKEAQYGGTPVCIEYFSSVFSGWTFNIKNDLSIYLFNFYEVVDDTKVHNGIVQAPSAIFDCEDYRYIEQDFNVSINLDDLAEEITSSKITFTAGTQTKEVTNAEISTDGKNYTFTIPAEEIDIEKGMESFTIRIDVTNGYDISYSGEKEITIKDEPFFEDLTPRANSQTGDEKKPEISAKVGNVGEGPVFKVTINDEEITDFTFEDGRLTYNPKADLKDGRTTVTIEVTREDGVSADKTWSFIVGKSEYQLYFGQLHSHTTYSDGSGTLDTALEYISEIPESANIQFVAFTDHSNYFDSTSAANPADALNDKSLMTDASRKVWEEYNNKVAAFNAKQSDLIAIAGFEMTWSGGPGHINTFDSDGLVSRNNAELNNKTNDAGMKLYYETINKGNSLNQFNHPGSTFGTFTDFSYWNEETDARMFLVEVGNGEGQIGQGGYYPSYEEYTKALDKGWHLAPTNNQDNHKGRWGNANDARDVILTNDFSEQGIYDAIRNLRVYATEDKNLELTYTVNGEQMGTIFDTDVPSELNLEVTVYDPNESDSISKVEVIVNSGKVVHTWNDPTELAAGQLTATLEPAYSYYYIRVTQADGDLAVTAPVWVGSNASAEITNVTADPEIAKKGENLILTSNFTNKADAAATIKSITYTTDGSKVLGTDTTTRTIAANGTLDVPFTFVPDVAKRMTVKVTAVIDIDGREVTSTKDITVSVRENDGDLPVSPISDVQAQTKEGYEFAIEGVVTSNASGYDKDTAFFDCIYVQDETGGICCFPVSGEYKIGDKVHVEGYTDFYQGEPELQVTSIDVIGDGSVESKSVTAKQINDLSVLGSLITIKGTVESYEVVNGLIQTIMVKDEAGDVARVFIDGYITTGKEVANCKDGAEITVTGISSYDDTFNAPEGPFPRIRIRNRDDIVCKAADDPNQDDPKQDDPKQDDPKQDDPKQDDPKQDDSKQDDTKKDDTKDDSNTSNTDKKYGTGLYKVDGLWKYYEKGVFKKATGIVHRPDTKTWHYVENGIFKKATGLAKRVQPGNHYGEWFYVKNGTLNKGTGLVKRIQPGNHYGEWFYVKDGKYNKATGLVKRIQPGNHYGEWFYVKNGTLNKGTGLVKCVQPGISQGKWYFVKNGTLNKGTGLVKCIQPGISKGKWYYVASGKLKKATGVVRCIQPGTSYGKWYYVKKGKLAKSTGWFKRVVDATKVQVVKGKAKA